MLPSIKTCWSAGMRRSRSRSTIVDARQPQTQINVRLLEPVDRYYVLGEVQSPGSYPLKGHETVLDGLLAAGGLTSSAAPCKILLARPTLPSSCRVTLPVCYREIKQMGDTTTNYQLQPGDRVFVAARDWSEEWMFWQANQPCPRCRDCQSACPDPSIAGFANPLAAVPAGPLSMLPVALPEAESRLTQTGVSPTGADRLQPASPAVGPATSVTVPVRLPAATDGELEFGASDPSSERFEPLWIHAAPERQAEATSPPSR
jgi:hypothetical protein